MENEPLFVAELTPLTKNPVIRLTLPTPKFGVFFTLKRDSTLAQAQKLAETLNGAVTAIVPEHRIPD